MFTILNWGVDNFPKFSKAGKFSNKLWQNILQSYHHTSNIIYTELGSYFKKMLTELFIIWIFQKNFQYDNKAIEQKTKKYTSKYLNGLLTYLTTITIIEPHEMKKLNRKNKNIKTNGWKYLFIARMIPHLFRYMNKFFWKEFFILHNALGVMVSKISLILLFMSWVLVTGFSYTLV